MSKYRAPDAGFTTHQFRLARAGHTKSMALSLLLKEARRFQWSHLAVLHRWEAGTRRQRQWAAHIRTKFPDLVQKWEAE